MIKVNLLGSKLEQNPHILYFSSIWMISLGLFFISCIGWNLFLTSNIKNLDEKNNNLKSQIKVLEEKTKKVNDIEKIKKDLNDKLSIITILKKNKLGPVKLLDELNLIIPDKVWLESILESNQNITITGKSLDDYSLSLFMKSLENSPFFKNVDLNYSKQFFLEDVKIKDFEIKAKIYYTNNKKTKVTYNF